MTTKDRSDTNGAAANQPRRLLFGRRRGRRLTPLREQRMEGWLPRLSVTLPEAGGQLDPATLFAAPVAETWLEIGFGVGDHLLAQAEAHPDIGLIGCEPFLNGVAKLVNEVVLRAEKGDRGPAERIRILPDDARLLLTALPDACLTRAFVLFPDPWPKKRHLWRRIVNPETVAQLARILKPGGELRLATDVPDYAEQMRQGIAAEPRFNLLAEGLGGWPGRPADWPSSKYERKALAAGRICRYFRYLRQPDAAR